MTPRTSSPLRPLVLLTTLLLVTATCTDQGTIDTLVVVQETNVPDAPPPCQGYEFRYDVTITRTCDGAETQAHVCADVELCENQIEEATAALSDCSQSHGHSSTVGADC